MLVSFYAVKESLLLALNLAIIAISEEYKSKVLGGVCSRTLVSPRLCIRISVHRLQTMLRGPCWGQGTGEKWPLGGLFWRERYFYFKMMFIVA